MQGASLLCCTENTSSVLYEFGLITMMEKKENKTPELGGLKRLSMLTGSI